MTRAEAAAFMLKDLEQNRLEVVLIPAPDPRFQDHQIRAVEGMNPDWYRDLCHSHQVRRTRPRQSFKSDTAIRRPQVIAALQKIAAGQEDKTEYARRLAPYIEQFKKENK